MWKVETSLYRWLGRAKQDPVERLLYAGFAGGLVLICACWFYSSMRLQTLYSVAWQSLDYPDLIRAGQAPTAGPWSAPLDDVFIHFDFARSWARGRAFEWSFGNGYSSGDTSLLYPMVLGVGYLFGFQDNLMFFAALVAVVSVFATLLAARNVFRGLPKAYSYLAPVGLLSIGGLNWTLFSGMEVALFLALWGFSFVLWDDLVRSTDARAAPLNLLKLGLAASLLVATRPEAVSTVGVFWLCTLLALKPEFNLRLHLGILARVVGPAVLVVLLQTLANYSFTGESSAAGAIAKLELHSPYLSREEVWEAWKFHLSYEVVRLTYHHFSALPGLGFWVWVLALVPLAFRKTRLTAILLWMSLVSWGMVVALNGQVRWQNERYLMPAVAWVMLSAALGLGLLLELLVRGLRERRTSWVAAGVFSVLTTGLFAIYQVPRFKNEVWFFGRASRNIWDQHVAMGKRLKVMRQSGKVLVGDAGAIPYVADMPAIDIIGLGGLRDLPFARATRFGVGAALELIERLPSQERPNLMALYPTWWGDLPLWFGEEIANVPVRGNVIAGGANKVLYLADWSPLSRSSRPNTMHGSRAMVDALDFADLVSEREHKMAPLRRGTGYVAMKILSYQKGGEPVWDAGRIAQPGEFFEFSLARSSARASLVFRLAPTTNVDFDLWVEQRKVTTPRVFASDYWTDVEVPLGEVSIEQHSKAPSRMHVKLGSQTHPFTWFHVWLVE